MYSSAPISENADCGSGEDNVMFLDTEFLKTEDIVLRLHHTFNGDPVREWFPTYYFTICLPDGTNIGQCDLRLGHNENTWYGGNIGYRIEEPYRGHRYAAKACLLLFALAKRHGMKYLTITCNPENTASARTCEIAGCMLVETVDLPPHNEMYRKGERQKRIYRIDL